MSYLSLPPVSVDRIHELARPVRYVFFDVDGTLIDDTRSGGSVWKRIHALAGVTQEERDRRQALHRSGAISYEDWMSLDIEEWQRAGVTREQITEITNTLQLTPGARETVETLHQRGYRIGIISSSIDLGILSLIPKRFFQELSINKLFFCDRGLISGWDTSACRLTGKGDRLRDFAAQHGVRPDEIAFVGNDFNDVEAAQFVGLSFAVHCISEDLRRAVSWTDTTGDLRSLLRFLPSRQS